MQGLGRQLMAATSEGLESQGISSLYLWVLENNPARAFYEKLGGTLVGEKPWRNNSYSGTEIAQVCYGWYDIRPLFEGSH